jgi:hypothetical protein
VELSFDSAREELMKALKEETRVIKLLFDSKFDTEPPSAEKIAGTMTTTHL